MSEQKSEQNKKVLLTKAMTWAGVNYAPGVNKMPEAAAASAVKRKLGTVVGEKSETAEQSADFTPLSFEDTMKRFEEGDQASEVFESLKFYQPKIAEARKSGMSVQEVLEKETPDAGGGGDTPPEGLPEDFPMKHVFDKLGADFDSIEKIQAMSFDDLVAADGIGEATAKKALAYGK